MAALLGTWLSPGEAKAWLFHEHHELGLYSVYRLAPSRRAQIEKLWKEWREHVNRGNRLCKSAAAGKSRKLCSGADCATVPGTEDDVGDCVDFAMLPAIAADHSCTPDELTQTVLNADWLREIVRIAFRTRALIEQAKDSDARLDAWHGTHIKNEMADDKYLSRADANNAHFMLVRKTADTLDTYLARSVDPAQPVNSVALYVLYHRAALELGLSLSKMTPSEAGYFDLLAQAMMSEAFALHFLEDSFSAGHIVGTWGISPERMGTHDYYCENGIDAHTWDGSRYTAKGDGNMQPKDVNHSVPALTESLSQFVDATLGDYSIRDGAPHISKAEALRLMRIDSCTATQLPSGQEDFALSSLSSAVLVQTIEPGLGPKDAYLPRFRNEVGAFARFYSGFRLGGNFGGYQSPAPFYAPRPRGDLEVGFGVGYGFEGIVTRSTDGVVFAQLTGIAQSKEKDLVCPDPCEDDRTLAGDGDRVPSRLGLGIRLRVPNLLFPGDSLIAVPLTMLFDFHAGKRLALKAADGGVGGLWRRSGKGQFVLFREVGVNIYGLLFGTPVFRRSDGVREEFTSVEVDLPWYEYRPLRRFNTDQTSTLMLQVGTSGDFNRYGHAFLLYARVGFDGRVYF
ncbi:MAG: hypothetical protein H6718_01595 [Polyangiaceae bacterium]|nr:hypothetical protein [Polyangiaceae bacterium]